MSELGTSQADLGLAWMNGHFIESEEAKLHVRTDAIMRGGTVFEGLAGYWDQKGSQLWLFRLEEHMGRLSRSMHALRMDLGYPLSELRSAIIELIRRTRARQDIHLRPTVYFGAGDPFAFDRASIDVGAFVTLVPFPRGAKTSRGITACVSSWQRISDRDQPPRIKSGANYLNGRLAQVQAKVDGYDLPILLNARGSVAEAPGGCIVLVRDGCLITPRTSDGTLDSITRATVLDLADRGLDARVEQRAVDRTELYEADELFECGTAHEITPIVAVDRFKVGDGEPGPLTKALQDLYRRVVHGEEPSYLEWLTGVY